MLLVVGGYARKIGKTSVVSGLIRGIPEAGWVAAKITHHAHAGSGDAASPVRLEEERVPGITDTGRYLDAGAGRAFLLRAPRCQSAALVTALGQVIACGKNVILESNSILEYVQPDLYMVVMDAGRDDCKDSARRYLHRANALVIVSAVGMGGKQGFGTQPVPQFAVAPPEYVTPELLAFVRNRL